MKALKYIGIGILGIMVVLAVTSMLMSTDFDYEKSISIHAPIDVVWEHTNSLEDLNSWAPWNGYDTNMQQVLTGTDGQVGAMSSWDSPVEKVGKGSQTITRIEAPTAFESDIHFIRPYDSKAKAYVHLRADGDNTIVTWGIKSKMPRPVNIMGLFMDMKAELDNDFGVGLNNLKKMAESH